MLNIYKKDDDGNKGEVHLKFGYMNLSELSSLFSILRCVLKEINLKMQNLKFCVNMHSTYIHLMVTHWPVRPDILEFKIVRLSIQGKNIVTNYAQLSILKLFSAVLSIRTSFRNTFYRMNIT